MVDDDGQLARKRRVIRLAVRNRCGNQVAGAVLVLQAFAAECGAARCGTQQKAARPLVRRRPDLVADALKAEHRVVNVEGQHRQPVYAVAGSRRRPACQCAGFTDAFFQNLSVHRFAVTQHRADVFRCVALAHAGINADLFEQIGHAEGARFVGNDRNDFRPEFGVFQQATEHAHKGHGGAHFLAVSSQGEIPILRQGGDIDDDCRGVALRQITA